MRLNIFPLICLNVIKSIQYFCVSVVYSVGIVLRMWSFVTVRRVWSPGLLAVFFIWFSAWFILQLWRWRPYVLPKHLKIFELYSIIIRNTVFFTVAAVRNTNPNLVTLAQRKFPLNVVDSEDCVGIVYLLHLIITNSCCCLYRTI
jgi:hypothetical protein